MIDLLTPLSVIVLWLDFAGLTTLIGTLAFQYLIIRPVSLSPRGFEPFEGLLRRVEAGALMLVALVSVLELLLRALVMGGGILSNAAGALPSMLLDTRQGTIWVVRIALVGILGLGWLFGPQRTWFTGIRLLGAVAIALTRSLSGHAADWGDVTLPVLIDWLHLLAVSIWIGGLFVMGFVLRAALTPTSNEDAAMGFALIARRFSILATVCVVGLLTTGLFHPRLRLMSFSTLFWIPYGWTLMVKLSLVLLMLMLAALNRSYLLPRLGRGSDGRARLLVTTIGRLEWLLAVFVLVSSAWLTQLTPARHISRYEYREPHAVHRQAGDVAPAPSPTERQ
ncbi:MAG TPA: CopD family protein [Verrucomicrobiae bacterium]|nr:CopD family protein [Verrucomicrobiae bacterium]